MRATCASGPGDWATRQDPTAPLLFETLINVMRMMQGEVQDREEAIKRYIENFPEIPSMRATLANLYFRLGRREDARESSLLWPLRTSLRSRATPVGL